MSGSRPGPDLILVNLIHQALRADAQRLAAAVTALDPADRPGRLPGIRAYYDYYRAQLATHHAHEDELFFPALQARVGAGTMHLDALAGQHQALDAALHAAGDALATLADPAGDFTTDRTQAAGALSMLAELLAAHLDLEEQTALPLTESHMPAAEYNKLEAKARKATPRPQAQFTIPWVIAHSTADQQKALYRSAPPSRLLYWLNRRRYRHLDQALTPPHDSRPQRPSPDQRDQRSPPRARTGSPNGRHGWHAESATRPAITGQSGTPAPLVPCGPVGSNTNVSTQSNGSNTNLAQFTCTQRAIPGHEPARSLGLPC